MDKTKQPALPANDLNRVLDADAAQSQQQKTRSDSGVHRKAATTGPVLVIGAGLLGTSIGLSLSELGITVYLRDMSPTALDLATDMRAGIAPAGEINPTLVIVCTPPDVAGQTVHAALQEFPRAIVTDVASVKTKILEQVIELGGDQRRYIGAHPMAGRERSGAVFARADLFQGRPFVLVPHPLTCSEAVLTLRALALDLGSLPIEMSAGEHDQSVALVSHIPQLVASLLAGTLSNTTNSSLELAGQGLRDTTRIARSDPKLWSQIVVANARPIKTILHHYTRRLTELTEALERAEAGTGSAVGAVTQVIHQGNLGVERIPGKHGGAPRRYSELLVVIPDRPGHLGKLFQEIGQAEVNIEDFKLEHSPGAAIGIGQILVEPRQLLYLQHFLSDRGWKIAGANQ